MYFIDEEKIKLVTECPDCNEGRIDPGNDCSPSCVAKKLEEEHKKVVYEMLTCCLPNIKVEVIFLENAESLLSHGEYEKGVFAGTRPTLKRLYIPWYTLRSKWQFFNVMVHELSHFIAYEKKYSIAERKIIEKLHYLEISPLSNDQERGNYYIENKEFIDRCMKEIKESKIGHGYDPGFLEYKKLFWKFYNHPDFQKYTYGKITEPLKYGFDEEGKGEYKEEMVSYYKEQK